MRLCFATNNLHKLEEVQKMLADYIKVIGLREAGCREEIAETGTTLEENSRIKARYLKDNYQLDGFADDTGLEVKALGGAPGVYSARYAGEPSDSRRNVELLLSNLEGEHDRKARFRTVITLIIGEQEWQFEGIAEGRITQDCRGDGGFGYDPVFVPDGYDLTFAEMDIAEKNRISHRFLAVDKLVEFLKHYQ